MNLSFLLPKTRRDFAAAGRRLARLEKRGAGSLEREREEDLTTKDTNRHETGKIIDGKIIGITEGEAGPCLVKPSGAAFSNPSPSELARDSENSSLTRSASGPAGAVEPPCTEGGPVEYASHSTGERGRRTEENAEKLNTRAIAQSPRERQMCGPGRATVAKRSKS